MITLQQEDTPRVSGLDLKQVGGRIGAEVSGIALSAELDAATILALRAELVRHKVLFFRAQHHLDDAAHEAFTERFGDIVKHATLPARAGTKAILELDSAHGAIANQWHTDLTFRHEIPDLSVLRGVMIPQVGGDTMFANSVTAYEGMPAPLRSLADGLWAVHTNNFDYANDVSSLDPEARRKRAETHASTFLSNVYETEHPVVHVHPESGARALLVGHFIRRISGLDLADSQKLLEIFQAHVARPENTVRWRWQTGDVVIWDNRATQHRAIADFGSERRIVRRVTVRGQVATSVSGATSRAIKPIPAS